jgi:hypothetical protein
MCIPWRARRWGGVECGLQAHATGLEQGCSATVRVAGPVAVAGGEARKPRRVARGAPRTGGDAES